jgi:hypothetical protein
LYFLLFLFIFPLGLSAVVAYWSIVLLLSVLVLIWSWLDRRRGAVLRGIAMDVAIMSVMIGVIFGVYRAWSTR